MRIICSMILFKLKGVDAILRITIFFFYFKYLHSHQFSLQLVSKLWMFFHQIPNKLE